MAVCGGVFEDFGGAGVYVCHYYALICDVPCYLIHHKVVVLWMSFILAGIASKLSTNSSGKPTDIHNSIMNVLTVNDEAHLCEISEKCEK
jgi:hypothetical protein